MEQAITIATFENPTEADMLRQELEDAGIRAWLSDDATASALWYVGSAIGGVKVQISSDDEIIAQKLLGDRVRRRERNAEANEWYCGVCREWISPSFDICWSCRGARHEVEKTQAVPTPEKTENEDTRDQDEEDVESLIGRIWRSSILGWAVCPPIAIPPAVHLYSLLLSVDIDTDSISDDLRRKLILSRVSNWGAVAVFLLFWAYILLI